MNVLHVVRRESQRLLRRGWLAAWLLPAAAAVGLLTATAGVLADGAWLSLPRALPPLAWVLAVAAAWALGRLVRERFLSRAAPPAVAAAIEREQGLRRGSLTGLLEVADSGVFAAYEAERLGGQLAHAGEEPAPRLRRRLQRAAVLSVLAAVQILLLVGASWARRPDGWQALLNPLDAWRGALVAPLRLVDVPARALRGGPIAVTVEAPGRSRVTLRWRATGGAWVEERLDVDADGVARTDVAATGSAITLLASDGRAGRDSATVVIVDRPFVGEVRVTAQYPAYLGRADETFPADALLRIPRGTALTVSGTASTELADVQLVNGANASALTVDGPRFTGELRPTRSGRWSWQVRGAQQPIADVPPAVEIEVVDDSLPRVEILSPTGERHVDAETELVLELLAQDDYGLRRVALRVTRVGADSAPVADRVLSEARDLLWSEAAVLELAPFALEPGEGLDVTLVAVDAAPGAREAVSPVLRLRRPTADEAREAARLAGDAAVAAADAAARAQAELAERTADESRARGARQAAGGEQEGGAQGSQQGESPREALGYDGAERAREIAEQQRQLREEVQRLEDASRTLEEQLQRAGALDPELARQLQEAQQLLRDAMTPEMTQALEELESSAQSLDGARTRQSLQALAQQQQRMRETLERSAEMLRRAALEGQMQSLADQSRELAEQQRAAADSGASRPPTPEEAAAMAQRAEDLAQRAEQLSERLEQAQAQPGAEATAQGAQQAREAADAMRQASQNPQQSAQQAAQQAGQAAGAMERAAESLEGAREQQVGAWKAELTDALDRSVQELGQLAREQDALAEEARERRESQGLRGAQSALQQGVETAGERLEDAARRTSLISRRSQELMERAEQRAEQAGTAAAEGRAGQAEEAMRESAEALRQAASQLTRDRERAANASSATGMAEMLAEMQQMAQQQGGLNSQLQSLLAMMRQQAGREQGLDAAGREQARQMARAQREVARRLDDVADADPTGRTQELAREAQALATALDQGAVDPSTRARQEQLLRRMLDAGRSLEQDQREESQRREARASRSTERLRPGERVDATPGARYRVPSWEELRGLSAEDRRLVIEYFRRLNAGERP